MKLSDEARELRNKYQREWNRRNRDKLHEYQRKYWERKVAQVQSDYRSETE